MSNTELLEQLKHPNPHMRDRAMLDIVDNRNDETISLLMDALDEEDTTYRRAAVKTLGAIGLDAIPPILKSLRDSDNGTVRSSCAKALAQVAINYPDETFPEAAIAGLKTSLNDMNPVVHIASAMALGVVGVPALDALIEVLEETENLGLAVSLVNAISSIDSPKALEVLTAKANDDSVDGYIKETAISALSRLELVQSQLTRG